MNKGFTLVELLIVLAISTFLIGLALVGTQNTQAQITLNSAAASFISNVNFVKNSAMSGSVQLGSDSVSPQSNWVYGFGILPGTLGINPTDGCTVIAQCATGYYMAILQKNTIGACHDSTPNTSPPLNNSLLSVNNLIDCSFAGGVVGGTVFPPPISPAKNWYYHQSLPLGVTLSISPYNRFPIFQELTGEIYIYDTGTGQIESSSSSRNTKTIFTLSYEGYSIPITFYDLYYNNGSSNNANTFHEGNIIHG